jgi:hypothetical protein
MNLQVEQALQKRSILEMIRCEHKRQADLLVEIEVWIIFVFSMLIIAMGKCTKEGICQQGRTL